VFPHAIHCSVFHKEANMLYPNNYINTVTDTKLYHTLSLSPFTDSCVSLRAICVVQTVMMMMAILAGGRLVIIRRQRVLYSVRSQYPLCQWSYYYSRTTITLSGYFHDKWQGGVIRGAGGGGKGSCTPHFFHFFSV